MDYNSYMNKFEKFRLNLSVARHNKNMSAYELSLRIGKDSTYINKIESGVCNPSLATIFDILEVLEIDANELFK